MAQNSRWLQGLYVRRKRFSILIAASILAGTSSALIASSPEVGASSPRSVLPASPVGEQARWFVGAAIHAPIPTAEIDEHFDRSFLAQISPQELNQPLEGAISIRLDSITNETPETLVFVVTVNTTMKLSVSIAVDSAGLISGLLLKPASTASVPNAPTTWSAAERQLRGVAPTVRFLVASVSGGSCHEIRGFDARTPAPLGSAFKLYVLDALARAIMAGRVGWSERLTITAAVKSLPGGTLQNEPDGTRVSVQQAATDMISLSDNTAADMLIDLVGRSAVERAMTESGANDPDLDIPFLTTHELFILKLHDWPVLADRYLAFDRVRRAEFLRRTVDPLRVTLASAASWTGPRAINSLEWFASPTDICKVFASLDGLATERGLAPLAGVLEANDGDIDLPSRNWHHVWFKGGSEPGVLTLNYLAIRDDKTYVVSALTEDPAEAIATTKDLALIGALKGAFEIASR